MRKYRGEWQEAYQLLEDWGNWHWVNRDRLGGLGYPRIESAYRAAYGPGGDVNFCLPEMSEDQQAVEYAVRHCCPPHLQRLAKVMFCDYPLDSWKQLAERRKVTLRGLYTARDQLLALVSGAVQMRVVVECE